MTGKNFSNRLIKLKMIRLEKGLTRQELARQSGVKALKIKARKLVDNETAKYL